MDRAAVAAEPGRTDHRRAPLAADRSLGQRPQHLLGTVGLASFALGALGLIFLAGWWLALHHVVLAIPLAASIIGIPFAWQHLKLAMISLAPVGRGVVET